MLNILAFAGETATEGGNNNNLWVILALVAIFVVMMILMMIPQRKQRKKMAETLDKLAPGDKITTAGGIMATIVEINNEENYFIIQTGSEENPTTLKILKNAIYSFDSVARIEEEERQRIEEEERIRAEKEALKQGKADSRNAERVNDEEIKLDVDTTEKADDSTENN